MVRHCGRFKCREPENHIENYSKAIADNKRWEIHHRLETHKYNKRTGGWEEREYSIPKEALIAAGLYNNVPAWQLIFLPSSEHIKLHNRLSKWDELFTEESRKKIAEANKKRSDWGKKYADNAKGSHWYTNGNINIRLHENEEIPNGFKKGRANVIWVKGNKDER